MQYYFLTLIKTPIYLIMIYWHINYCTLKTSDSREKKYKYKYRYYHKEDGIIPQNHLKQQTEIIDKMPPLSINSSILDEN
jgi:hypothetical protein